MFIKETGNFMKTKVSALTIAVLAGSISVAAAQEQDASKAGVITTESGIDFVPALLLGVKHDDNITRASSGEISSWVTTVAPSLKANLVDGANTYTVSTALRNGTYLDSSEDNFTDGYLDAEARLSPSSSHNFKFKANGSWLHEERGTGTSTGRGALFNEVTKFNTQLLDAEYKLGASSALAGFRFNTRYFNKDYDNNLTLTEFREYDASSLGAAFMYGVQDSIKLVADVATSDIQYKKEELAIRGGSRDNQDTYYRLGAEWDITSVTTGTLRTGYQDKDFDLVSRDDFSGVSWEAILNWMPLSYSGFDVATGRRAKDVEVYDTNGDYIIERTYAIGWNHQWDDIWSTKVSYEYMTEDYNRIVRNDTNRIATFEVKGKVLRWLTVKAFVNGQNRDSSVALLGYDRNVIGLDFELTL
jgi:hypothetical protein